MAQELYTSAPAQRHTARPRPTVAQLEKYLSEHTIDQAAQRWNVHPRTISKWRARADAPQATVLAQDVRTIRTTVDTIPMFVPTTDDVAGDGTMWRDPWLGELTPVPPGIHRKAWEAERIAARERHRAAVEARTNHDVSTTNDIMTDVSTLHASCPTVDITSSEDDHNTVELEQSTPAALPLPLPCPTPLPLPYNVAVSQSPALSGRPPHRYTSTALRGRETPLPSYPPRRDSVRYYLSNIDQLMGPELGLIVAAILIAITWGFS